MWIFSEVYKKEITLFFHYYKKASLVTPDIIIKNLPTKTLKSKNHHFS